MKGKISKPIMCDPDDLEEFDKIVGIGNRSSAIRKLIKEFIQKHKGEESDDRKN